MVWPGLNTKDGGRDSSISKTLLDNHRRCSSSTVWIFSGLSGVVKAVFFFKAQFSIYWNGVGLRCLVKLAKASQRKIVEDKKEFLLLNPSR